MSNAGVQVKKTLILIGLLYLAACSGPQLKLEPIPATANPTEETNKLAAEMASARQQQVNLLSPTWFEKAEVSLAEAKDNISRKGDIDTITTSISRGRAELAKAQEMANIARTVIPDAIKGRDLARVAGATALGEDYATVEAQFLELTRDIEENNLSYAQRNQKKVVDAFRVIEIRAIKENTLGEVRKLLKQAEEEGAKKIAPQIFDHVQKELQNVDDFISANPYDKKQMHEKAATALFQANRLVQLTRQSKWFQKMKPIDVALWIDDFLRQASVNLGAPDMRDQPLEIQVANILGTASALKADRDFLSQKSKKQLEEIYSLRMQHSDEISTLQTKLKSEMGQKAQVEAAKRTEQERLAAEKRAVEEKLARERKFNELYNQVQSLFTSDEAECYKQGLQMVVRLRAMSFPVGQAIILPENYPLLSKIQRAIRTFADPSVTIEGHTDSTGSLDLNNHLSQKRAEAVREYLLANGVITKDKITAIGYGPSRPLAPNTTAEGRAQNRRIDVVITPKGQPAP